MAEDTKALFQTMLDASKKIYESTRRGPTWLTLPKDCVEGDPPQLTEKGVGFLLMLGFFSEEEIREALAEDEALILMSTVSPSLL